jgi:DNA helicase-2/ATP-dependent DNA helicase PcrA
MKYNSEQQAAVLHQDGPALVLAGPGSGKTAVITGRVQALISQYHIPPSQILVVTFTRAAAREMEERFRRLSDGEAAVTFGTIHAISYKILRVSRPRAAYSVISPAARRRLIREALAEAGLEPEGERTEELEAEILARKSAPDKAAGGESGILPPEVFERVFAAYESRRREAGLLDFEDLLRECLELFENRSVLNWWQDRFRYLLVDEFQDVNSLQYRFLQQLAAGRNNLFAVGDEDQTIYGFRGARQKIILGFPKEYPGTEVYRLEACYRCSSRILGAAEQMIRCNRQRFAKKLRSLAGIGEMPRLYAFPEKKDELEALVRAVRREHQAGTEYQQMAVLARTRFGLRQAAAALWKAGVPYRREEDPGGDYQVPAALDLFAYLRLGTGGTAREDWLRIANRPLRYLPRRAFPEVQVKRESLWQFAADKPSLQQALLRLFFDLDRLGGLRPFAAIEYIRREMEYDKFLSAQEREKGHDPAPVLELLDRLQEESALFATAAEWEEARRGMEEKKPPAENEAPSLRLLTMHGAKGLEFDAVFLPGLNEGTIPGPKSAGEEDVEAERRLLFVAMTRARRRLWMSYVTKRRGARLYPSRFLKETGLMAEKGK